MKNLTFSYHQNFLLIAQASKNPSSVEWDGMLEVIRVRSGRPKAVVVSSDGGSPSVLQRKQLRDALNSLSSEQRPPLVMFTSSALVRMGLTALKVFVESPMVAFSPAQWTEVKQHLGLTAEEAQEAAQALNVLRAELGLAPLREPS